MQKAKIDQFFARLAAKNPDPKTELDFASPFTLLAAVVLSAQATDASVNRATPALFAVADTPAKMAALGPDGILPYIKTIGLYRTKARNLARLAAMLVEKHGGTVPTARDALQVLPGVGRKTASVVLNAVFDQPTIAVDTHVFRVSNRTGLAPGKDADAVEDELMRVVPERWQMGAHHWLILHGRYTCVARAPKCPTCPVADLCAYPHKTPAASVTPRPKPASKQRPKRRARPSQQRRAARAQSGKPRRG
jgi:endonuclease-3